MIENSEYLCYDIPVSIIVPVFMAEKQIERCLHSLIVQTFSDMEFIVVYRPGSDRTLDIIQSIKDPRIHIIYQEELTGSGGARNMGIRAARGKYVGFVEADDFVDSDFFEKLYNSAEAYGAEVSFAGTMIGNKPWVTHDEETVLTNFFDILTNFVNAASFDKLFRASFLSEKNIWFSENTKWEDNLFIVKVAYFSRGIVTVPQTFYHYFPSQWTTEYRKRLEHDAVFVIHEIVDFAHERKMARADMQALGSFIYRSFAACVWDEPAV